MKGFGKRARVGLAIGAAAAASGIGMLVVPSTFAGFTDSTTNPGNAVDAGTLQVTNSKTGTYVFSFDKVKPGDVKTATVTITNSGSLAAAEAMSVANIAHTTCDTDECANAEGGATGQGDLSDYATIQIHDDTKGADVVAAGTKINALHDASSPYQLAGTAAAKWAPAEGHTFTFTVTFPSGTAAVDNAYQGTGASFDVSFGGAQ